MTIRLVMDLGAQSKMSYPPVNDSKLMRDNLLPTFDDQHFFLFLFSPFLRPLCGVIPFKLIHKQ